MTMFLLIWALAATGAALFLVFRARLAAVAGGLLDKIKSKL
jgi:hypothetical protein